ncbi:Spectrin beta chain, non-erythrocytic 5 [Saguinus oedipus]|uniref:Spectrin beta chain, non-erythrocytic 5 n=1 Tax=Saguinus oedipus TaxID=9490 RepID=A0ABQ9VJX3_SAGOE|nr:Spectrin beta chain, non-erythrocytic 5 [Saguinus oedipus]
MDLQVEESSPEPSSAPLKLSAHQWLRAELEAREKLWQRASQLGTPAKEVQEGLRALQDQRDQVFQGWARKQERLQAEQQEQLFLRECGHLEEILRAQEVSLETSPLGSSVEEVEQLIRKHNVFLKRLKALRGPRGQDPLPAVLQRRARVKELAESRGHALCASLLMAGFIQAATQAEDWIQEPIPAGDLREKLKPLLKHQAFEAEFRAHEEELEDKQKFLEFLQRVDLAEAWIQEKEVMVSAGDLGQDLEHCLQLRRRLHEFRGASAGDTVGDARIRSISDLSLQLKNRDPEEVKVICQRRSQLNNRWASFRGNLLRYQQQLEGALEIHTLSRELDNVTERIREKDALIQALDCGKDLESMQRLLRKHEELEREIHPIQTQKRREALDALHQAQNLQAMLQKLLVAPLLAALRKPGEC